MSTRVEEDLEVELLLRELEDCPDNNDNVPVNDHDDIPDDDDVDDDNEVESTFRDPPEGHVRLRPSCIAQLPSTVFVEYPPELKLKRNDLSIVEPLGSRKLSYKSHWERTCIRNAFKRAGFAKGGKYWTAMWSKHQNQTQLDDLHCLQRINHFPASWCIGRKDRLSRTLMTMKRIHGKEFDFHPDTFVMPNDRDAFRRIVKAELAAQDAATTKKSKKANMGYWIVKPCASSCGRGISVVNTSQAWAIAEKKKVLIQRYLTRPYLINKKKFDLRIYVLVTGVDPLRVYIHDEGLTRISTSDFSLNNISNRFAHLTNYSVNKKAEVFKAASYEPASTSSAASSTDNSRPEETDEYLDPAEMEGYKWSLKAFRKWLTQKEGKDKMEDTFRKISDICVKTMVAAEGEITPHLQRSVSYRTNCFELFGCDVILDDQLNPHLLEVNVSPSLMGSSPLDKRIKGVLVADVLHTVGMFTYDTKFLKKYCFQHLDAQELNAIVSSFASSSSSSMTSSSKRASSAGGDADGVAMLGGNPFAFSNLTKVMSNQDAYRRNACPATIDLNALRQVEENNSVEYCSWWQMMLMAEDEIARSKSSGFKILHPTPQKATHYTSLFRNPRFSDHLLARWVEVGGSKGVGYQYLPAPIRVQLPTPVLKKDNAKPPAVPRPRSALPTRPGTVNEERPDKPRRPTSAVRSQHSAPPYGSNQHSEPPHVTETKELQARWERINLNASSSQRQPQFASERDAFNDVVNRVLRSSREGNASFVPTAPAMPPSAPSPVRNSKSFSDSLAQDLSNTKISSLNLSAREETNQSVASKVCNPNQNTRNQTMATSPTNRSATTNLTPRKETTCGGLLPASHPSFGLPKVPSQSVNSPSNKIAAMRAMAAATNMHTAMMMLPKPTSTATAAAMMQNQQMVGILPARKASYTVGGNIIESRSAKR